MTIKIKIYGNILKISTFIKIIVKHIRQKMYRYWRLKTTLYYWK